MIFAVVTIIVLVCVAGTLGITAVFLAKDNDYLKTASDSQSATFRDLRETIEIQNKLIVKLEAELGSKNQP
jgi:hypothetical protein